MAQGAAGSRRREPVQRALRIDEDQDDVRLDLARALEQAGRGAAAQAGYRAPRRRPRDAAGDPPRGA